MSKIRHFIPVLALLLIKGFSGQVQANGGIVTDGSVGSQGFPSGTPGYLGSVHTLSPGGGGSDVNVTQSMGTTLGHNVFQSFSQFNISKGQTVTFEEDNKGFVDNVIARVTGKETSQINGTLRVTPDGGRANFYLLNPNGVLFGNGASIDVPGDFHVTTAHFIKFQDGAKYGSDPVHSHLTTAAPASFGFTASNHSNNVLIDVTDGAQLKNPATPNKAIDLVAQNIKIENSSAVSANDVRLVAAKGNTSVSLNKDVYGNLALPKFAPTAANAGKVLIDGNDTTVTSGGDGGGRIAMSGQKIALSNGATVSSINNSDISSNPSQGISIKSNNVSIDSDSIIESTTNGAGAAKGGDINIYATSSISMKGLGRETRHPILAFPLFSYQISSLTMGVGAAGNISLKSGGDINLSGTGIVSITGGLGSSGNISLSGETISLNQSEIGVNNGFWDEALAKDATANPICFTCGTLGSIFISANKSININHFSDIRSDDYFEINSIAPARNGGGHVTVLSPNILLKNGSNIELHGEKDNMGGILVIAEESLSLIKRSNITTNPSYPIYVYSRGSILLSNRSSIGGGNFGGFNAIGQDIHVSSDSLLINNQSGIGSYGGDGSKANNILIKINGIFSIGNMLNGKSFTGEAIPTPTSAYKNIFSNPVADTGNYIATFGNGGDVVISGSLLNLSGAMANLGTPSYESDALSNSCDVIDKGSLMSGGKGGKGLNAMDRMIFGE